MFDHDAVADLDVADSHALVASLSELAPGPAAAALADVDRSCLSGEELAQVLRTEARVLAWMQAGMAASMVELADCPIDSPVEGLPHVWRSAGANTYADDEIALALGVSPNTARWHLERARFIRSCLPAAYAGWRERLLSQAKVWACFDALRDSDASVAAEFAHRFFDTIKEAADGLTPFERAAENTPAQLRDRAQRLVGRLDAGAASRRRARRLRGRRVVARHDRDGVGYLSGTELGIEEVATAYEHVDALARAIKNHGDPRPLNAIRADVFTTLLAGEDPDPQPPDEEPDPPEADPETQDVDESAGTDAGGAADTDTAADAAAENADDPGPQPSRGRRVAGRWVRPVAVRPVDLVVPYDLLRGGAMPGEIAGFGQLPADTMRRALQGTRRAHSTWALTVVDPASGRACAHVRVRHRPAGAPAGFGTGRLVELIVPRSAVSLPIEQLDPQHLVPVRVLRRLLDRARQAPSSWCSTTGPDGVARRHDRSAHDPTRGQAAFVRARDRRCCFPGCRRRAVRCDTDHRVPWERGGATCPCNLHPLCRHHHQLKQHPHWHVRYDRGNGADLWVSPHRLRVLNDTAGIDPELYELIPDG